MNETTKRRLFTAIEHGEVAAVEAIIAKHPEEVDVRGTHKRLCRGKTPLMYAMQCEAFYLARWFIARGADVRARIEGTTISVLVLAARFGHGLNPRHAEWLTFAEELLARGADPSEALWPALHDQRDDQTGMIELLLRAGADPEYAVPAGSIRELVRHNRALYSDKVLALVGVR